MDNNWLLYFAFKGKDRQVHKLGRELLRVYSKNKDFYSAEF